MEDRRKEGRKNRQRKEGRKEKQTMKGKMTKERGKEKSRTISRRKKDALKEEGR